MASSRKTQFSEPAVRHLIYSTFAATARPPTSGEVADHFKTSIAAVEKAFERLADAHHIALAPGSHSILMAHPFSGIPTDYTTEVGGKTYWGN
jgi:hypothetical protein